MRLYVALTLRAHRTAGPMVGADRLDVAAEVPDISQASYEKARKKSIKIFAESMGVREDSVYHFGTY